jgi:hypothetical protein
MLPVGARAPDLSQDELAQIARRRLHAALDRAS